MSKEQFEIRVEGSNPSETGRFARELRDVILNKMSSDTEVHIKRSDPTAQSLFDIIEVTVAHTAGHVAGTAMVAGGVILSKLLRDWLRQNPWARMSLNGEPIEAGPGEDKK